MKYAVTAAEMKAYDTDTIKRIGIASEVLMERAALAVIEELQKAVDKMQRILIVAGCGNNGGDGIAMGRILLLQGIKTDIVLAGDLEKCTGETRHQLQILENLGFSIKSKPEETEYDIIVDALFGIGLSREITGKYRDMIVDINRRKEQGAFVCAVDIASGVCADTGKVLGCGIKADMTVTFAYAKRGQLFYPGKEYTGKLIVKDIGITDRSFLVSKPEAFYYEPEDVREYLPVRKKDGNKGTFGKVLLIAGSSEMSGACLLCGKAIFRIGAGMVKIITPKCNRHVLQQMLPEAMLYTYDKEPEAAKISESLDWANVVVIGPGLSKDISAQMLLKYALNENKKPIVVDADGLNLIAENEEIANILKHRKTDGSASVIFTPHPGELVKLCGVGMDQYKAERMELLRNVAISYGAVIAGKDAVTVTAAPDKDEVIINTSGTDGMATAGSGDVLAGVIAGLLAQGTESFTAASLGVYLHGLAGEAAAGVLGRRGMMAGDIADALGYVLKYREDI